MAADGVIERTRRADGLIGNFVAGGAAIQPDHAEAQPRPRDRNPAGLHEDDLKRSLQEWLTAQGWSAEVAWGHTHGTDITATRGDAVWFIEAKGIGSRPEMRVNYFIGILGELLQRMQLPGAKYSIALPDVSQFRRLWDRLPALAKQRTQITALFVSTSGEVTEVE